MQNDAQNLIANGITVANIPGTATTLGDAVPTTPCKSLYLGGTRNRRLGDMDVEAFIHNAATAGGTSLRIILYVSESATAKTNAVSVADSGVIALATMANGYRFPLAINPSMKLNSSGSAADLYLISEFITVGTFTGTAKLTMGLVPHEGVQTAQV